MIEDFLPPQACGGLFMLFQQSEDEAWRLGDSHKPSLYESWDPVLKMDRGKEERRSLFFLYFLLFSIVYFSWPWHPFSQKEKHRHQDFCSQAHYAWFANFANKTNYFMTGLKLDLYSQLRLSWCYASYFTVRFCLLFLFMCMAILLTCMSVYYMHVWCPEDGVSSLEWEL